MSTHRKVAVIGLGYVGLPVAVAFGKKSKTIGFDINERRVRELRDGLDTTREVTSEELKGSDLSLTSDEKELAAADFFIVTVPTPINDAKQPDLTAICSASQIIGRQMKKGSIVVYESTVFPGATEDVCVPILSRESGLKSGEDFWVGYSPERINPGDPEHRFENIKKVVSGQDEDSLRIVSETYGSVVKAGIYEAESIKVAEAAKVIENTQRDLNIALMNELAVLFNRLGIDTQSVLEAAATKWNFLKFKPGLVGGHCIGVDPYYLTHKAETEGYHPQVILAGRRINDSMGNFVAQSTIREMLKSKIELVNSRVTVLGLTFKENCPDIRNTKVVDVIRELEGFGLSVSVCDPVADPVEAKEIYGIELLPFEKLEPSDAVVRAVAHDEYRDLSERKFAKVFKEPSVLIDVKSTHHQSSFDHRPIKVWRM